MISTTFGSPLVVNRLDCPRTKSWGSDLDLEDCTNQIPDNAATTYHIPAPRHHMVDEPHHFSRRILRLLFGEQIIRRFHLPYWTPKPRQVREGVRKARWL